MTRRILFLSICPILLYASLAFAQSSQPEEISITTYYPSPYGVYNEMQLYPHSTPVTPCDSTAKGTMYYDSDDGQVKICDGSDWKAVGGIPAGMIAMFDASCPTGWTRFSALDGKFPFGGSTYGSTGGSSTHTHTMSVQGVPWGPLAQFSGANCGSPPCQYTGLAIYTPTTLYVLPQIASTESNLPPYLTVVWCKKN